MKKQKKLGHKGHTKKLVPPKSFVFGQDLKWKAPWVDVNLWVELPFWLMVNNTTVPVAVEVRVSYCHSR